MKQTHLNLPRRRALMVLSLWFEGVADDADRESENLRDAAEGMIRALTLRACSESEAAPLDTFLSNSKSPLRSILPPSEAQESRSEEKPKAAWARPARIASFVDRFEESVDRVDCSACALRAGEEKVCRVESEELHVVQQGDCLKHIREVLVAAEAQANSLFVRAAARYSLRLSRPTLSLSTVALNKPGDVLESDFGVSASTECADNGVNIKVKFVSPKNDFRLTSAGYFSLAYLLTHEVLCHSRYAILGRRERKRGTKPTNSFLEGWMDLIAYELCQEGLKAYPVVVGQAQLSMLGYYSKRLGHPDVGSVLREPVIQRREGVRAAGAWKQVLRVSCESTSPELFRDTSLAWNLLGMSEAEARGIAFFLANKKSDAQVAKLQTIADNIGSVGVEESLEHLIALAFA